MAGGLDIRRETVRIRREQARRNAEAIAEAEARRTKMATNASKERGRQSDKRKQTTVFPKVEPGPSREGHRLVYSQKVLDQVEFASPAAQSLAEEAQLGPEEFKGYEASSDKGFTAGDVREIIKALEEDDDDDDEDWDDDDLEEDDDEEEKMDRTKHEDKMRRGGDNK
jgi:hypothetical protein